MMVKKKLSWWPAALVILVALGLAAMLLFSVNPTVDRDALVRARAKPGGSTPPVTSTYGTAKGTPINHEAPGQVVDPRRKPGPN